MLKDPNLYNIFLTEDSLDDERLKALVQTLTKLRIRNKTINLLIPAKYYESIGLAIKKKSYYIALHGLKYTSLAPLVDKVILINDSGSSIQILEDNT